MANLNKISFTTPLVRVVLKEDLKHYDQCTTDEELADFYHKMLNKHEAKERIAYPVIYAMISQSLGKSLRNLPTTL